MGFATNCPKCGVAVKVPTKLADTEVICPKCGNPFTAGLDAGEPAPPSDDFSHAGLLDWVESLLWRMIVGVFRFALVRLPRLAYDFALEVSPTLAQVVRIFILAAVWAVTVIAPGLAGWYLREVLDWMDRWGASYPAQAWCAAHESACRAALVAWSGVALCGSLWGAAYLRRKTRRRRAAAEEGA